MLELGQVNLKALMEQIQIEKDSHPSLTYRTRHTERRAI
jgi:hypothetical protein